jgi:hypothetical protein
MIKKSTEQTYDKIPCSCGRHFGLGVWTAEKRALVYAWYRDDFRKGYTPEMARWLASWQRFHEYINTKD